MAELDPAVEEQLAGLDDASWRALTARVRPPTSTQQLREIAGKVLEGPALDSFVAVADPRKFAGENGDVDEDKVMGQLTALFTSGQSTQPNWGQGSAPGGPTSQPGDAARAALKRRHGVESGTDQPTAESQIRPGADARAALQRRHPGGSKK